MKCAVLGCGPAGLMAAHAVVRAGHEPTIFSYKQKSPLGGAQFLHRHIPGLTSEYPDAVAYFRKLGTEEGYAEKIYGFDPPKTSWSSYPGGTMPVWNLNGVYDLLWEMFESRICNWEVSWSDIPSFVNSYAAVFSTIPYPVTCQNPSQWEWKTEDVWIEYGENPDISGLGDNIIEYNGEANVPYYRRSSLFGYHSREYPHARPPAEGRLVRKPLHTDCTEWPQLLRLGRYGLWKKGVLTHHAYTGALNYLSPGAEP